MYVYIFKHSCRCSPRIFPHTIQTIQNQKKKKKEALKHVCMYTYINIHVGVVLENLHMYTHMHVSTLLLSVLNSLNSVRKYWALWWIYGALLWRHRALLRRNRALLIRSRMMTLYCGNVRLFGG